MPKEENRADVLRTTKVRTKLKADGSWMHRVSDGQANEEKPCKPASTSMSNGFRSSPAVRRAGPAAPSEDQLSPEEHEKRMTAASSVLKDSPVRRARSYVLSAAKKFESGENEPDTSLNSSPSFVAKRVEITDEGESAAPTATKSPTIQPDMKPGCTKVDTPLPMLLLDAPSWDSRLSEVKDTRPVAETPVRGESAAEEPSPNQTSVEQEPVPEISNSIVLTDDLLFLTGGPVELDEPVPPSPGRWSQDLLGGPVSHSVNNSLNLLADDVIPIDTEVRSLSAHTTDQDDEWYKKSTDIPSSTEKDPVSWGSQVTTTTVTTTSSSTDPFDPYPIGTTSPNSSEDLVSLHNTSPAEGDLDSGISALEALAEDVIPIDTDTKRQEEVPVSRGQDQQTLVTFERKSLENDSPWDRWTSPTVVTVASPPEEESPGETETHTVTTVTTVRETYSDQEPAMDRALTGQDAQRVETPEPKKSFVYVKEYVNETELSLHNARSDLGGGSEYLTSSASSYSYNSPTTYSSSLSSTCNYCGELVGNEAKITIEHLNVNCHPDCFKCGICSKPMGDLLYSMFLHGGVVHCESCYSQTMD
ncbi:hypothetical protein NHX12_011851 [Muraenolepis orangiensis]|uniref:LIM zinc-binding domain-containing protein n=1 Tax=Muraenolepis orangiensis TaxID=630683 RepID=A0A9Q0DKI9_9TELE|nr:hypothetical protein NHX12_011851 [Muraenolepis orangiensis]